MAQFTTSEYGKYVSLQNVSASADPASAPGGGVYLFASGTAGSSKLYLQNEGSSSPLDVASLSVDIDGFSALGGTGIAQGDNLLFSDAGTEKKITFSNFEDAIFGNLSGDATVAAGGALTIAADAVENSMLANITRGSVKVGGASDAPTDLDAKTSGQILVGDGTDIASVAVSGDATLAANGALTISAGAVENSMLADDAVDSDELAAGAVDLAHMSVNSVDSDQYVDGSIDLVHMSANSVDSDQYVDGSIDTAHIANDQITNALMADDAIDSAQIADGAVDLAHMSVNSIDSDQYIDGSVDNVHLANDSVTIGSTECDLGSTTTVFAGITQLTASNARITNLDVVTLNSLSQTEQTLEITDKLIVASVSASSANTAGGGLKIGGGQDVAAHASLLWDHTNSALDFNIGGTTEIRLADGVLRPETDNDVDLGASGAEFKDLYLDGRAYIDSLIMPDVTSGKFLVADGTSYEEVALSGDATLASGGALTISAGVIENSMLADDAVDSDEIAAGAIDLAHMSVNSIDSDQYVDGSIDTAHLADNQVTLAKMAGLAAASLILGDSNGDPAAVALSGDVTLTNAGVAAIGAQKVLNSMLADDAVGADELAADAVVNASVAAGAAIVATKLNFNVDLGGNVQFGTQTDDSVAFGGSISVGSNVIANAQGEATISMDNDQNVAIAAAATVGGGYASSGATISSAGAIQAKGALTVGADGAGVNAKFFGGAANEHMSYDAGNHVLYFANASSATILTLGGDATSEYALDVANGANNQNKVRASAFVTYSDESLKCEVQTMNNALDTVMSLNGVEFTWNDSGDRDFGFIAQEVQAVLPKAVHVATDGVQGVDYSRLTSVLVEAVKAQQIQITDLKKALTNLKK